MGHRANFVVIEKGNAEAFYDNWAGLGAAWGIGDGPAAAVASAKAFEATTALLYFDYFAKIAPHWAGWRLRYDDCGVDAFAEHLRKRAITSVELQASSHPENPCSCEYQA